VNALRAAQERSAPASGHRRAATAVRPPRAGEEARGKSARVEGAAKVRGHATKRGRSVLRRELGREHRRHLPAPMGAQSATTARSRGTRIKPPDLLRVGHGSVCDVDGHFHAGREGGVLRSAARVSRGGQRACTAPLRHRVGLGALVPAAENTGKVAQGADHVRVEPAAAR
jgi:hypothetical protein